MASFGNQRISQSAVVSQIAVILHIFTKITYLLFFSVKYHINTLPFYICFTRKDTIRYNTEQDFRDLWRAE